MSRPTPADRTRLLLRRAADALEDIPSRVVVLGGGIVANLGLHLVLADPNIAWASAPLVLLAGLVGGVRVAVAIALAVGIGHTVIDVTLGLGVGAASATCCASSCSWGSRWSGRRAR
jgi:hypothetical protein